MEELKFRVYDVQKKKMYYNAFPSFGDTVIYMDGGVRKVLSKDLGDDYIIMQFTGLKDKKNKEIYEGDIVETEYGVSVIKYQIGGFLPFQIIEGEDIFDCWHWSYCLVVGNIYENPELLDITNCDG